MGWARISDDFYEHAKVAELTLDLEGLAALGLWTLALSWVRADRRRGNTISVGNCLRLASGNGKQLASRLVDVGLWEEAEGGWRFHDFEDVYDPEGLSEKRAAAGRAGGKASGRARRKAMSKQTPSNSEATCLDSEAQSFEASYARAASTSHSPLSEKPSPPSPPEPSLAVEAEPEEGEGILVDDLVAKACAERPDWVPRDVFKAINDCHPRPLWLIAAALPIVMADPDTQLPGRLPTRGYWWSQAAQKARASPPEVVEGAHAFDDDGSGNGRCRACNFPKANSRHRTTRSNP